MGWLRECNCSRVTMAELHGRLSHCPTPPLHRDCSRNLRLPADRMIHFSSAMSWDIWRLTAWITVRIHPLTSISYTPRITEVQIGSLPPTRGNHCIFFSEGTGWALARKIHRTTDGGFTWKAIANVNWDVEVDFVTEQVGWGVARAETEFALVKTIDGGAKWAMLAPRVGP